jgi:hypothetical protein
MIKHKEFSDLVLTTIDKIKVYTKDVYTNVAVNFGVQIIVGYESAFNENRVMFDLNVKPYLVGTLNGVNFWCDPNKKWTEINLYDKEGTLLLDLEKDFSPNDFI